MKHLLFILLLSGSVWGQGVNTIIPSQEDYIREIVRAEIERWWREKDVPDTANWHLTFVVPDTISDTISMYVPDTVWELTHSYVLPEPEPLQMVIDTVRRPFCDTTWIMCAVFNCDCGGTPFINCYGDYVIDTLYRLTPEQVEKLR